MRVARAAMVTVLLAFSLLATAPAAQAEIIKVGERCTGIAAYRCGWMHVDTTNNLVRGYASILTNDFDAQVAIVSVRLYRSTNPGGPWTEVAHGGNGGWFYLHDADSTSLATCFVGHYYHVDYRWLFKDTGYQTNQVYSSHTARLSC
jgi:hypothetical protein